MPTNPKSLGCRTRESTKRETARTTRFVHNAQSLAAPPRSVLRLRSFIGLVVIPFRGVSERMSCVAFAFGKRQAGRNESEYLSSSRSVRTAWSGSHCCLPRTSDGESQCSRSADRKSFSTQPSYRRYPSLNGKKLQNSHRSTVCIRHGMRSAARTASSPRSVVDRLSGQVRTCYMELGAFNTNLITAMQH
jgi:hypothetical protein